MENLYWVYFAIVVLSCLSVGIIRGYIFFKMYGANKEGIKNAINDKVLEKQFKANKYQSES